MAASLPCRSVKEVNYALFNITGRKHGKMVNKRDEIEEGQIEESPLRIHHDAEDDDFHSGSMNSQLLDIDQERGLEDTLIEEGDNESVHKFHEEESVLSLNDTEIVKDEVWERQQEILRSNREKREYLRIQLEQKKKLNEQLLWQEQERREIAHMEKEVSELEQRRSVRNPIIANLGKYGRTGNNVSPHSNVLTRIKTSKVTYGDEFAMYDARPEQGAQNPLKGKDKVNKWLASNDDLTAIHETRSEPGECNKKLIPLKSNYRKAVCKQAVPLQPRRSQPPQGTHGCQRGS